MRAEDKTATERELEQRLREEQDVTAMLRRELSAARFMRNLAIGSLIAFCITVTVAANIDQADHDRVLYWQTRRGDYFRDEAARLLDQRDICWDALDKAVAP